MNATLGLASLALLALPQEFELPEGFRVEDAAELSQPFIAMTFAADGAILLSVEGGGILRLSDDDGDGYFETSSSFSEQPRTCQGLAWFEGALYATGIGPESVGLFRLRPDAQGTRAESVERMIAITSAGEHGPHAIAPGPDGKLYVAVGNHALFESNPERGSPLVQGYEGNLLEPYDDPGGHAVGMRYPAGFVARIDPDTAAWSYHSVGYRNAYDLAFDDFGELFSCDADMEWDVGLPWYRPVRVVHCAPGADFGWRSGSGKWPSWYFDSLPAVVDVGRGSPTGVCFYLHDRFPERYRGAFLVGDWTEGRILALHLNPDGAGWSGEVEVLLQGQEGFPVTDLEVGPDGSLYFTSGGRGTPGRLRRLVYGDPVLSDEQADPVDLALEQAQPWSAWGRERTRMLRERAGSGWRTKLEAAARDSARAARPRARALQLLRAETGAVAVPLLRELFGDSDARLRAASVSHLAAGGGSWSGRLLLQGLSDPDPAVRRRACEVVFRDPRPSLRVLTALIDQLRNPDRRVRYAARAALKHHGVPTADDNIPPQDVRTGLEVALLETRLLRPFWSRVKSFVTADLSGDEELDLLRVCELELLENGEPARATGDFMRELLAQRFPASDARVAREQAILLAHWHPPGTIDRLLDAIASADPEQQIHYVYCLHRIREGWTPAQRQLLFSWFERAADWTGGNSFSGYLAKMRDRFVDGMTPEECLELARTEVSAHTLALFMGRLEGEQAALSIGHLRQAWERMEKGERGSTAHARKSTVLRALRGVRAPGLIEFLRELLRAEGDHEALWIALADFGDERDWSTFVTGLATPSREVREACARALGRIERDPEPLIWRGVLDTAARFGYPRGNLHLGVMSKWRGAGAGARDAEEWGGVVAGWETWFRERWPDYAPAMAEATPAPVWSEAQILAFLTRSSARPGSPVLGAFVFAKATCSTCHVVPSWNPGPVPNGWGPDLAGVTKRFDTKGLLDTIVNPSSFISDQYQTQVVICTDEERLDGRLISEDADGVTLLFDDGEQLTIPHDEIESRRVSELSTMPEGLLAPLTLEQIKDLFAYLASEGVQPSSEPGWVDFLAATGMRTGAVAPLWTLRNSVLVGHSDGISENDYLYGETPFADFELELDVFLTPGANSGLQYRSRRDPATVDPVGLQLDLGQRNWGSLYASDGRGTLTGADPRLADVLDPGGWNHVFARVRGDRHTFEINGLTTVDERDAAHAEGLFAFQLHSGRPMEVRIANARLKPLD